MYLQCKLSLILVAEKLLSTFYIKTGHIINGE